MPKETKNKSSRSRERLSKLLREGGELFTVTHAARILGISNDETAKTLARWCNQGWLTRIKRGIYVAVPVEAASAERTLEDAWVLIPELFSPAYVGGWSAAEYWDLTEQIFRDICIYSAKPVTKRRQVIHHIPFIVTHAALDQHFGSKPVWKNGKKILVSDPTKTIVDILSNPWAGGGIQHVADCLKQFFKSDSFNVAQLIDYVEKLGNGAVYKRLGFLATQMLEKNHPLIAACEARLSKGNAQLDPALKSDRLITRWRLFVPVSLSLEGKVE